MDGQDVQTLCCENQALAAQTLRCLGTPVVKIQEEGVGPWCSASCSPLCGRAAWPPRAPCAGKAPALVPSTQQATVNPTLAHRLWRGGQVSKRGVELNLCV